MSTFARVWVWTVIAALLFSPAASAQFLSPSTPDASSAISAFHSRYGPDWDITTDAGAVQIIGSRYTPRFPDLRRAAAAFIDDNRDLLGVASADLRVHRTGRQVITYQQTYRGIDVYGSSVVVATDRNGDITSLSSTALPELSLSTTPQLTAQKATDLFKNRELRLNPRLRRLDPAIQDQLQRLTPTVRTIIYPTGGQAGLAYELSFPPASPPALYVAIVDANAGILLNLENRLRHVDGTVTSDILLDYTLSSSEQPVSLPLQYLDVTATPATDEPAMADTTDESGQYAIDERSGTLTVQAGLAGPNVLVYNDDGAEASHTKTVPASSRHDIDFAGEDQSDRHEESVVFYYANLAHEYFTQGDPDLTLDQIPAVVEYFTDYCNAFYSGGAGTEWYLSDGTIVESPALFFGAGCGNLALSGDVIIHEYTHYVLDQLYPPGLPLHPWIGEGGAIQEALADYFAATINNDACYANGFDGGACMRDLDNTEKDFHGVNSGESHYKSLALSGALWDLREALGADLTDQLVMDVIARQPVTFRQFLELLLVVDDEPRPGGLFMPGQDLSPSGSSNLADGTPHIGEICNAFYDKHEIYSPYCAGSTDGTMAFIDPPSGWVLRGEADIIGTAFPATDAALTSWTFEAALNDPGKLTPPLSQSAWTVISSGTSPVKGGLLGTIDTTPLQNNFYWIRLTVTDSSGTTQRTGGITVSYLQSGWPRQTADHAGIFTINSPYSNPRVADLDNNGKQEVIIGDAAGLLHVFNYDGAPVSGSDSGLFAPGGLAPPLASGFPAKTGGLIASTPAVADIDSDGKMEIVVGSYDGKVYAFNHDGSLVPGWPYQTGDAIHSSAAIGDLDNNGDLEIVIGSNDNKVYAFHHDGTLLSGWPKTLEGDVEQTPSLTDLDNDGKLEVIAAGLVSPAKVHAFKYDGKEVTGWPVTLEGYLEAPTVSADLNRDGKTEVFAQTGSKAYLFKSDGTLLPGWPIIAGNTNIPLGLADADNDNQLEIVKSGAIFEYDGSYRVVSLGTGITPLAIADTDNDGKVEYIGNQFGSCDGYYCYSSYLKLWEDDGTQTLSIGISGDLGGVFPAISDLDNDGDVEVVTRNDLGQLYVFDLSYPYDEAGMEWPTYQGNERNTGFSSGPGQAAQAAPSPAPQPASQSFIQNIGRYPIRGYLSITLETPNVIPEDSDTISLADGGVLFQQPDHTLILQDAAGNEVVLSSHANQLAVTPAGAITWQEEITLTRRGQPSSQTRLFTYTYYPATGRLSRTAAQSSSATPPVLAQDTATIVLLDDRETRTLRIIRPGESLDLKAIMDTETEPAILKAGTYTLHITFVNGRGDLIQTRNGALLDEHITFIVEDDDALAESSPALSQPAAATPQQPAPPSPPPVAPELPSLRDRDPAGQPAAPAGQQPKTADFNNDGRVDRHDTAIFGAAYNARQGEDRYNPEADLNGDGEIGRDDLTLFQEQFGKRV